MRREELVELHYIAPIVNVESILRLGLLSHWRAESVPHESVAMQEIQDRRSRVTVPGGRPLHHYVNLYICARNPMLYVRKDVHRRLTVLKVSQQVLDLAGVAVADRNASSDYVRFASAPDGLRLVDRELVFAEYWTHPDDPLMALQHKSIKCAEVLVPDRVDPRYVTGAYVSCESSRQEIQRIAPALDLVVDPHFFFQARR